jgi:hypothetical protein
LRPSVEICIKVLTLAINGAAEPRSLRRFVGQHPLLQNQSWHGRRATMTRRTAILMKPALGSCE